LAPQQDDGKRKPQQAPCCRRRLSEPIKFARRHCQIEKLERASSIEGKRQERWHIRFEWPPAATESHGGFPRGTSEHQNIKASVRFPPDTIK
jgi:hypothetical protein